MKKYTVRFYVSIVVNSDNIDDTESKLTDFILSFRKETDSFEPIIEFNEVKEDEEFFLNSSLLISLHVLRVN